MFWVKWREMRKDTTYLQRPGDKVVSDTSRADAEPDIDCLECTVSVTGWKDALTAGNRMVLRSDSLELVKSCSSL